MIPWVHIKTDYLQLDETYSIENEKFHHLINVLRLKKENNIICFDLNAGVYDGIIEDIQRKSCLIRIKDTKKYSPQHPAHIHIGQPILSSHKMDWIIQKLTELGVDEITLLHTKRSKPVNHIKKKSHHFHKIIIHACEQAHRPHLPTLNPNILSLEEWGLAQKDKDIRFACSISESTPINIKPSSETQKIAVTTGPESGFTTEEMLTLTALNFTPVSLGQYILRAETAAITTIAILQNQLILNKNSTKT